MVIPLDDYCILREIHGTGSGRVINRASGVPRHVCF